MTSNFNSAPPPPDSQISTVLSPGVLRLLACAVGIIAANLYYAQPLVAQISRAVGLAPAAAGLVVTLTQIGYGLGVLLIVPLGDVVESRRLVLTMIFFAVMGVLGLGFVTHLVPYFFAALITGLGASTVQILMPYAAHFAPEGGRGRAVGNLTSGLMIGIMLSRPTASLLTDLFSWHAVFVLSAVLMALLGVVLYFILPARPPTNSGLRYTALVRSMAHLFLNTPVLRRRAIYQGFLFGAFCLFWTASPLLLAGEFRLSQTAIALFALVGVSGAVSAPFAGRAADRNQSAGATRVAMIASSLSFLVSLLFRQLMPAGSILSLAALVGSAVLLDAGITANLVLGQRAIFALAPEFRSRLNGLYIAVIFVGGACGSTLGAWAYARGGWMLTSFVGFAMPACALLFFATEKTETA